MNNIFLLLKKHVSLPFDKTPNLPGAKNLWQIFPRLSGTEKIILSFLCLVFLISVFGLLAKINNYFFVEIPISGGEITEGIIGGPRFINPILATTEADKDLTRLVFASLLRPGEDGYEPELAQSFEINEDGKTITARLKENIFWHDGQSISSDDIIFTINHLKDSLVRSPLAGSWDGVTATAADEKTIIFTLSQPYSPFLENLTLGILPKHAWEEIRPQEMAFSEKNLEAIGAGPYQIKEINRSGSGVPESIVLERFNGYVLGAPYLEKITFRFFNDEETLLDAYRKRKINSASGFSKLTFEKLPDEEKKKLIKLPLPRIFGVFFNQNTLVLARPEIREALDLSLDRKKIVEGALGGVGTPINGPVLRPQPEKTKTPAKIDEVKKNLADKGWKINDTGVLELKTRKETLALKFTLTTANSEELIGVAEEIKSAWEKLGAEIEISTLDITDLNENVIRPRKYDVLLFGEIIGRFPDPFAFWHSSQRFDPGLNISLYANAANDKLLTGLRETYRPEKQNELLKTFVENISKDRPALFLYAPDYLYLPTTDVEGIKIENIAGPADRFANIHQWFLYKEKVWSNFLK